VLAKKIFFETLSTESQRKWPTYKVTFEHLEEVEGRKVLKSNELEWPEE